MDIDPKRTHWIANFGRNLRFRPKLVIQPRTVDELLTVMNQVKGRRIRVVGRRHGWSRGIESENVLIDLTNFDSVETTQRGNEKWAVIGAGCQIKHALSELDRQAGWTLPAVGLITEQSIAGACSTATHGSGRHSLSHYLEEVQIACYDRQSGKAVIRIVSAGPELQAARCSLGCLGIIVAVGLKCVSQYEVEDHFQSFPTLEASLATEDQFPAQQLYFLPWLWKYYAQQRRTATGQGGLSSWLYRWYTFLVFDVAFHLVIAILARWLPFRSLIHFFFKWVAPCTVIQNWKAVGKSYSMLTMEHELFRHIEVEIFVQRQYLPEAMDLLQAAQKKLDGDPHAISELMQMKLESAGTWDWLASHQGQYTHHYHVTIRRVLPDDTLISMASHWDAPCYALSVISYAKPSQRKMFNEFAEFLSKSMVSLFEGRPHWGKVCPISAADAERLYPRLPQFRAIADEFDPKGVFRNRWISKVLFDHEENE